MLYRKNVRFLGSNNGVPLGLEALSNAAGVHDLKSHLYHGYGFGDDFDKLSVYVKDLLRELPSNVDMDIIRSAKEVLGGYRDIYEARHRELQKSLGYKSSFQGRVHEFIDDK